jgi:trk system potassium uptake protein TrkH
MGPALFSRVLTFPLGITAAAMALPLALALWYGEAGMIRGLGFTAAAALALILPVGALTRKRRIRFSAADGFLLVFSAWIGVCLLGAAPYCFAEPGLSFSAAVFESVSGFTTTGATLIPDMEALPRSLLFWRSLTHWAGGMGIILLTAALMPLLGIGGFQLVKTELPGPDKERITPKIAATAKSLWLVYGSLTAVLTLLYLAGGMDWFDALCHGFSTMATGGVSTKNQGLAYYRSGFIDGVTTVFMLLSGLNFNLYYRLLRGKPREVLNNTEARAYLGIFAAAALVLTLSLVPVYGSFPEALRRGAFQTASILSTAGYTVPGYETWPKIAGMTLFILMLIGGCSGSTAGGIKVIRLVVLWKQAGSELRRLLSPQGVFSIRLNKRVGRRDVIYDAAAFVTLYFLVIALTTLLTAAAGTDLFSALTAALALTGNIGLDFGAPGGYGAFPVPVKWLFSLVMIAGRLELRTALILLSPEYWRR